METLIDEVAQMIAMSFSGWSVIECEMSERLQCAEDLQHELYWQDELAAESDVAICSLVGIRDDLTMLSELSRDKIYIVVCDAETIEATAEALEAGRGRFVLGPRIVLVTGPNGAKALAQAAPNIWSWVGSRYWQKIRRTPIFDREARLASFRMATGLTDEQITTAAEAGSLNSDPVFAEWLSLLGRGDLLGN